MITTLLYKNKELQKYTSLPLEHWDGKSKDILWIDLNNPTLQEISLVLEKTFCFHQLAIEDCHPKEREPNAETSHHPKIDDYGDYLFLIFNAIRENEISTDHDFFTIYQLSAFLGKNYLVTVHYDTIPTVVEWMNKCATNIQFMQRGPDYLMYILLDGLVDYYTPVIDTLDSDIDILEDDIFSTPSNSSLFKILTIKRKISRLHRISISQRELLSRLSRGEFPLISQREAFYYRNVYDHLVRISDLTESYRDTLSTILEAYLSVISNRMNEVMKVLTIMGTIILPLTLLTGIYGMNFDFIPELHWKYGYFMVWGIMIVVATAMIIFFKKRRWM